MCVERNINHTKVSVESHRSNGRVERVIGTLREGLAKHKGDDLLERITQIQNIYNMTYHSGIKMSPGEAWLDESGIANIENSREGRYWKQFKKQKREEFKIGQQVLVAKRENLGVKAKAEKGKFLKKGVVVGICGGDSYLIRGEDGKISKKRHYDLKGHNIGMNETPSGEGDVICNK
jgi:hypothetical protein